MQGGGVPGLRILKDLRALVSIDGRPLMFAFAICSGAAVYFSVAVDPPLDAISAAAGFVPLDLLPIGQRLETCFF